MSLPVLGRLTLLSVLIGVVLATALTSTLTGVTFLTVVLAVALRVLGLRAGFTAGDLETVAVGIREKRVDSLIIHGKGLTRYQM